MAAPPSHCFNRRGFLVSTAATPLAGLVGQAEAQTPPAAPAAAPAGPEHAPPAAEQGARIFLNNPESDMLTALVDRLIPPGEGGPGGVESGVVTFIDHQLSGTFGAASNWYMRGPFAEGKPSQGWQYALTPAAMYRHSLEALDRVVRAESGKGVAELDEVQRDALLTRMEKQPFDLNGLPSSVFFELLLNNTIEGYFADPLYGGNRGAATWKQIGYPGANPVRGDLVTDKTPYDGDPVSIG
ncbi:gluconate 2-dehydrogenase subunit 3 family protein [Roseomonas sp. KE2513]|uniref:gluconate 2-dehydrogenase subunit 3 family protein n=1 Tax=Roseomonas sp. KE2513 TaxID=2479202 RepID=UPI0018E05142|nr:gluconate 2-dehydrogenase subunit 3 family protein [Roseomonas sp. KE2513]MBI0537993.1 gluconate 2-dehydrogenase subunit 3 family protein [Roseomonas sp. KE2513]